LGIVHSPDERRQIPAKDLREKPSFKGVHCKTKEKLNQKDENFLTRVSAMDASGRSWGIEGIS